MDTTLYVGLSHQVAMRRQMDIIANNIANVNTAAFKRESVMFREYIKDLEGNSTNALDKVAFVQDYGVHRRMTEGKLNVTDNPLDVAIGGDGLLVVERQDGSKAYTRNGHLQLSEDGILSSSSGHAILDNSGQKIQFPPETTNIKIAEDGSISTKESGFVARLDVVVFDDYSQLKKAGDSLYTTTEQPKPSENYKIAQGLTETSNVAPIVEIAAMINVSRSYMSMARTLENLQKSQSQAINRLANFS
ncbi:MAG: flagellar basal-body rod protein FlgF [Kordiimonas sp.]|nr:flagellar basal-body rod protein FlgF [Kordiimonas sp.]